MSIIDQTLNKLGLLSNQELLLKRPDMTEDERQRILKISGTGPTLAEVSDPAIMTKNLNLLAEILDKNEKALADMNGRLINGYQQAGSEIRKLYPNPFAPYAFVADNYWAAWKARREMRVETLRDGYVIVAPERYGKKQIKLAEQIFKELDIANFRATGADHLNVFGNCWINPITNSLGGLKKLEFLLPEKIIPKLDVASERVVGWWYVYGNRQYLLSLDSVDHIKTVSLRSLDLGTPSLQPLLIDIEASMFASIFNNTAFQKGGLIKALVSVESIPTNGNETIINPNTVFDFVGKLQQLYERQFSGVRGAMQLLFSPLVKDVHNLVNPKDLEGIYEKTNDRTATKVAVSLGCTPERIGISRTSQYVNNAQVDDSVSLSFDNNQYYLVDLMDDYINDVVIPNIFGNSDIKIQSTGEYGSISKTAAEFAKTIAEAGAFCVTVDEWRTKCMHWHPLGGELGKMFLGELTYELAVKAAGKTSASKYFENRGGDNMTIQGVKYIKHHLRDIKYY